MTEDNGDKADENSGRTLNLPPEDLLSEVDLDATFVDSVSSKVADNYRRLNADKRLVPVFEKLKRRGLDDRDIEFLLRNIALLPQEWESEKEGWKKRQERRAKMAKRLRKLAEDAIADPDLSRLYISGDTISYDSPPDAQDGLRPFTEILDIAASSLETTDRPLIMGEDGKTLTLEEYEKLHDRERKISEQSYILLGIFELLEPYYQPAPNSLPDTSLPWSIAIAPCSPAEMNERESTAIRSYAPKFNTSIPSVPKSQGRMPEVIGVAPVFQDQDGPCRAFDPENLKRQMENAQTNPNPPWKRKRTRRKTATPEPRRKKRIAICEEYLEEARKRIRGVGCLHAARLSACLDGPPSFGNRRLSENYGAVTFACGKPDNCVVKCVVIP